MAQPVLCGGGMRGSSTPWFSAAALLLLGACGSAGPETPTERVEGRITGRVTLEGPAAGAALRAKDGASEADTIFAWSTADEQGLYVLELGPLYGPVAVEAETTAQDRLETWLVLPQGESRSDVQVSPVTTLAAAWASGAVERGQTRADAWARGTDLVFGHLGDLEHGTVAPVDLRDAVDVVVDDGVRAGLIAHAFAEQALRWTRRSSGQGAPPVTVGVLTAAYTRDLADGLADGRDRFGAPVTAGAVELTPDSLRLDLSQALAAFLDGPRNGSRLRSTDVRDLLRAIREADGPLFPEGSLAERDQVGPTMALHWRKDGAPLEPGQPVTGAVELAVFAEDPSGVASLVGRMVTEPALELGMETWTDEATWSVDTISLEDGTHRVEVEATDGLDYVATATTALVVDHTAPTVSLEAPAQVDTPTVAITGQWFDVSGVVQVVLRVGGEVRIVLEDPNPRFEATVPLGCQGGATTTVEATATDAAGNVSTPAAVDVRCVGAGPSLVLLPSYVLDERDVAFEHGSDGALVGVSYPVSPRRVRLGEGAVWPVRVHKLFSRLDLVPGDAPEDDNLPVFRWRASGTAPLTVRYRTLVDDVEDRSWTPLALRADGRVDLPVAYQTFGSALVTAGPDAVHMAEVEVVDGQGARVVRRVALQVEALSPPVWVGQCAPTITPGSLRLGFSAGAPTEVEQARVVWDLGLVAGSLAPTNPARVRWLADTVTAEITSLGEDTWRPGTFTSNFWPRVSTPCWLQISGAARGYEGQQGGAPGLCGPGPYPDERRGAFVAGRDGRLSQASQIGLETEVRRGGALVVMDGQGRVELEPGDVYTAARRAMQPGLRLADGGPYTWPTTAQVPDGYAASVAAQGRARYPVWTFERAGVDYIFVGPEAGSGRRFVTRAYVEAVGLSVPAARLEADLPALGIEVPVTLDATCSASQTLEVQL